MFRNTSSKKCVRPQALSGISEPPQSPGVHVYLFWTPNGDRYLSHTSEEVTAETLCTSAAETVGISPLCYMLYGLYEPQSSCWYSPNHEFTLEENTHVVIYYCMRFYFRDCFGDNGRKLKISRYSQRSEKDQRGSPLLDISSLEYLFSQAKYEFVNNVIHIEDIRSEEELSHLKKESLGMAVLHLSHCAMQTNKELQEMAKKTGFHHCIPRSLAEQISREKSTKYKRLFKHFIQMFQEQTVDKGAQDIMLKYISSLENLVPCFGTENFSVSHLDLLEDGHECLYPESHHAQGESKDNCTATVTHEIMVSGVAGIQWRKVSMQKAQYNPRELTGRSSNAWTSFCDFPEITHITITENHVRVSTDSRCMEVYMKSTLEAHSFGSLLDGYYRLTVDAHHYLCRKVAPPGVVLSVANGLHGPIQDEYVLMKLNEEAVEEGAFLFRWSAIDHHCLLLVVLCRNENESSPTLKQFRIEQKGSKFCLKGLDKEYPSIKELSDSLKTFVIESEKDTFIVKKCCKPKSREISNLLVTRSTDEINNQLPKCSQIRFNKITDKEIVKEKHLGRGTRANIYSGFMVPTKQVKDSKKTKVVLKILDEIHKNISLDFFEIASFMDKVSHRNLVFVHGIAVKGSEYILVEEYVEFGPLDAFLCKEKAHISPQWKLLVAKQLASALSYLETKQLIHGNVCAKNVLVARRGLEPLTAPVVKLSDPGIALIALSYEERVERIPWVAPECIESGESFGTSSDQWSFGATLFEIFNNGILLTSFCTLSKKEQFYQQRLSLVESSSEKLTELIRMCLTYETAERPSFRTVLRELSEVTNPDITLPEPCNFMDPTVYHKRHMKEIRELGEGHFGKIILYQYDPSNDGTGEFVAVKCLKQDCKIVSDGWKMEIETLKSLCHKNIVRYKGCCTNPGGQLVELVMEYVPLGSLQKYACEHKPSMPHCLLFAQQICQGMAYLHSEHYVHRDLAARNILVENDNLVKIGDFGLSKYIPEGKMYYRVRENEDCPMYWHAIECLKEGIFSFASDIWSFGVTLYEILTHCDPRESPPIKFNEMNGSKRPKSPPLTMMALKDLLEEQKRLPCPRDCPHDVKMIMNQCWATDCDARPDFSSLIEQFEAILQKYNCGTNSISHGQIYKKLSLNYHPRETFFP